MFGKKLAIRAWVLFLLGSPGFLSPGEPQQWRILELSFAAQGAHERPLVDTRLQVRFEGPAGQAYEVTGFWDGDRTWKVRFTPTLPGEWSWRSRCEPASDAGLNDRQGRFTALPANGTTALQLHGGFLRASETRRSLTYTDGTPFFWLGDTWWWCPSDLVPFDRSSSPNRPSMYQALVQTRARQGYSIVQMMFLGKSGCMAEALIRSRESASPDLAYWREVDRCMDFINEAGLVPVIGLVFSSGMDSIPLEQWEFAWRYVVARYGAHAVTWLICGEYNSRDGDTKNRIPKVLKLGAFIKETDPWHRAMTVHPAWHGGDRHQAWGEPWHDFIMIQGSHQTRMSPGRYADAWKTQPPKPFVEAECDYEGISSQWAKVRAVTTDADVRYAAYRAMLSGCCGYTYGAHGLWYPIQDEKDATFAKEYGQAKPWWEAMEFPGGAQMTHLRAFCEQTEWWKLEPRPGDVVGDKQRVTPADVFLARDNPRVALLYFRRGFNPAEPIAIRGMKPSSPWQAEWFDPRNGTTRPPVMLPPARGDSRLVLPDRPDEEDWGLILRPSRSDRKQAAQEGPPSRGRGKKITFDVDLRDGFARIAEVEAAGYRRKATGREAHAARS